MAGQVKLNTALGGAVTLVPKDTAVDKVEYILGATSPTGASKMAVGTTAQRPTGETGMFRMNETTGNPEWWDPSTSSWKYFSQPSGYSVNYLVVAGGGGGGGATRGGGGGAGGVLTGTVTLSTGTAYTVVVGSGGASGPYGNSNEACAGSSGTNSSAFTQLANGGGGGGSSDSTGTGRSPSSGGSGGGGWYVQSGGSGTTGQGYAGGSGATTSPFGGGGGGAGAAGAAAGSGQGGGIGIQSSISGTPTYYGGGGSSSNFQINSGVPGGLGGGGVGCNANTVMGLSPANGAPNTGGGGGAAGNGGSGVVILSYLGSQRGTGGIVTSVGGYTIHTFTSSGTYNA